jgi:peptidoglycan/xylan/chitin deacetylase (PgdA/CDA1 family)
MHAFSRQLPRFLLSLSAVALAAVCAVPRASAEEPARVRKIAITIDDGPATGPNRELEPYIKISDALREAFVAEKVPAIMFVNERQLNLDGQRDARVALLHRWLEAGLELGNHTYSHPRVAEIGLPGFLDDIVKGEVITRPLLEARGRKLTWFRYPFLATGTGEQAKAIEEFLAQRAYRIAPVTVDYADYNHSGIYVRHLRAGDQAKADEQYATMLQALDASFARAETRSKEVLGYELPLVLLIHCNELNARTLRTTLQRMRERGYSFVSLDEAMSDPAYQVPLRPGGAGGGGWFNSLVAARAAAAPGK